MSDIKQIIPMPQHLVLLEKLYVTYDGCLCHHQHEKDPEFSHCEYNVKEDALLGLCFYTDGTSDVKPLVWDYDISAFDIAIDGKYVIVTRNWLKNHSIEEAFGDHPYIPSGNQEQIF